MRFLNELFNNNRAWAENVRSTDPDYFERLSQQQTPRYLWIGCADSRVPANQITGLAPGEVFVHRNIANIVNHTDFNSLSVIEYAVVYLKVSHIIVCGHYGCGGVQAAMQNNRLGLIDNWLRHIRDVRLQHRSELERLDEGAALDRLCELNVLEQVRNVAGTTIVQEAWDRGQELAVHGWIYRLRDGLLNDLEYCVSNPEEVSHIYRLAESC